MHASRTSRCAWFAAATCVVLLGAARGQEAGPGEPQAIVPGGAWFGAELARGVSFALVGCAVAPGFEFEDLEMADGAALAARFPAEAARIRRLTGGCLGGQRGPI